MARHPEARPPGFTCDRAELESLARAVLGRAKRAGASGCDCEVAEAHGLTVTVRKGKPDTIEHNRCARRLCAASRAATAYQHRQREPSDPVSRSIRVHCLRSLDDQANCSRPSNWRTLPTMPIATSLKENRHFAAGQTTIRPRVPVASLRQLRQRKQVIRSRSQPAFVVCQFERDEVSALGAGKLTAGSTFGANMMTPMPAKQSATPT